jgi:ABC-2 type transport system permease protein
VALALVLPLILLALLGTALSFSVKGIAVVVQDFDQTPLSLRYIDAINASRARAVVVIPENFERDFLRGQQAEAQWLIDAVDANTADSRSRWWASAHGGSANNLDDMRWAQAPGNRVR